MKLKQGLCIKLEEWDGERDGRQVQKGSDVYVPMADSCWGLTENHKIIIQIKSKLKIYIFD